MHPCHRRSPLAGESALYEARLITRCGNYGYSVNFYTLRLHSHVRFCVRVSHSCQGCVHLFLVKCGMAPHPHKWSVLHFWNSLPHVQYNNYVIAKYFTPQTPSESADTCSTSGSKIFSKTLTDQHIIQFDRLKISKLTCLGCVPE